MKKAIVLCMFASVVFLFGCSSEPEIPHPDNSATANYSAADLEAVVSAFIKENWPESSVSVEIDDTGRATLEGTVSSPAIKESIDTSVGLFNGVDRVRNRIDVAQ